MKVSVGTKVFTGCIVVISSLLICSVSFAENYTVPNTFSNGEVVSASEMNANFTALSNSIVAVASAVNSASTTIREADDSANTTEWFSAIKTVNCQAGEVLTGASCSCYHTNSNAATTYSGTVKSCLVAGNGVAGYCASDIYDVVVWGNKSYGPPITVQAICMSIGLTSSSSKLSAPLDSTEPIISDELLALKQKLEKQIQERERELNSLINNR
jgi:hypothetical protein